MSKVNVGESEPRTIVAGLAEYISKETLAEEDVVVLCNLKPRAVGGILSSGMLLCSSNVDKTQVRVLHKLTHVTSLQIFVSLLIHSDISFTTT